MDGILPDEPSILVHTSTLAELLRQCETIVLLRVEYNRDPLLMANDAIEQAQEAANAMHWMLLGLTGQRVDQ